MPRGDDAATLKKVLKLILIEFSVVKHRPTGNFDCLAIRAGVMVTR